MNQHALKRTSPMKRATALIVSALLAATGCQAIDPAMMGLSAGPPEENVEGLDCTQLAAQNKTLRATQTRLEAAARITGTDMYEVREQYNELRRKVADAQALAGCG
jgi:hypothetical protein